MGKKLVMKLIVSLIFSVLTGLLVWSPDAGFSAGYGPVGLGFGITFVLTMICLFVIDGIQRLMGQTHWALRGLVYFLTGLVTVSVLIAAFFRIMLWMA